MRNWQVLWTLALCVSGLAGVSCADESTGAFTEPTKAGPDYQVQGEYVGDLKLGKPRERLNKALRPS